MFECSICDDELTDDNACPLCKRCYKINVGDVDAFKKHIVQNFTEIHGQVAQLLNDVENLRIWTSDIYRRLQGILQKLAKGE